jgi:hypothetical protein
MNLTKRDGFFRGDGGDQPDGNEDEGKAKIA